VSAERLAGAPHPRLHHGFIRALMRATPIVDPATERRRIDDLTNNPH
jgi:hypothetical protein